MTENPADAAVNLIVLVGPTGVGKTGVSISLAGRLNAEIVSADSRLFYRGMDIGTAKPSMEERGGIPHHMIDVAEPDEEYSCKRFEVEARRVIRDILGRGKTALAVGGSGLYVKALTEGIFEGPAGDPKLRRTLTSEAKRKGKDHVWRMLVDVDPVKAAQIDPENLARVIRAIEVHQKTGTPMSELEKSAEPIDIPHVKFGLSRARKELYTRIEKRVDEMMNRGFLDEVKGLVGRGYAKARPVKGSLGYSELISHLEGSVALDRAVSLIKRNTRHFAKRQTTWFRKDIEITWLDITGRSNSKTIAGDIFKTLRG
ncbi:MAG: tRNA (adenosine(37)-N6)-dimethylallyltransferase MiaA [bacterium]